MLKKNTFYIEKKTRHECVGAKSYPSGAIAKLQNHDFRWVVNPSLFNRTFRKESRFFHNFYMS